MHTACLDIQKMCNFSPVAYLCVSHFLHSNSIKQLAFIIKMLYVTCDIPPIFYNLNMNYRVYKNSPLVPVLKRS